MAKMRSRWSPCCWKVTHFLHLFGSFSPEVYHSLHYPTGCQTQRIITHWWASKVNPSRHRTNPRLSSCVRRRWDSDVCLRGARCRTAIQAHPPVAYTMTTKIPHWSEQEWRAGQRRNATRQVEAHLGGSSLGRVTIYYWSRRDGFVNAADWGGTHLVIFVPWMLCYVPATRQ